MKTLTIHIRPLYLRFVALVLSLSALVSCKGFIDHLDNGICDYSVRIRYSYNEENTSRTNLIKTYVNTLEEYIFDEEGYLFAINPAAIDVCTGEMESKQMLPPGRYSLITVGNRNGMSVLSDNGKAPEIKVTHRDNFLMMLVNEQNNLSSNRGYYDNCERLYYTYRTFSVEENKISLVKADMLHSHCIIHFTIKWRGTPPADAGEYYVKMQTVPSEYNLMLEFVYPSPLSEYKLHNPAEDAYDVVTENVIHYIPTVHNDRNELIHRRYVSRLSNEISGQTITYRLRNDGQTTFSLFEKNGDARVMKDVPLVDFLLAMGIDLDHTLRQEYRIIFEILENGQVLVYFADIADWDEGGWVH